LGWVAALDSEGRTIWIVDAHPDNGKRFVVHADGQVRDPAVLRTIQALRQAIRVMEAQPGELP